MVRETNHSEGATRRQKVVSKKTLGRLSHIRVVCCPVKMPSLLCPFGKPVADINAGGLRKETLLLLLFIVDALFFFGSSMLSLPNYVPVVVLKN